VFTRKTSDVRGNLCETLGGVFDGGGGAPPAVAPAELLAPAPGPGHGPLLGLEP